MPNDAFIVRRGGSGGALNFRVLGSATQPTGSQNTIWVNTATAITGWSIVSEKPTWTGIAGQAAIICSTANGDTVSPCFNAVKKNGIYLKPTAAFQFLGGAWVQKEAKIYRNGAWVNWATYLFNNGDNTPLTGGWTAVKTDSSMGSAAIIDGKIEMHGATAYGGYAAAYQVLYTTTSKVNISGRSWLCAHIDSVSAAAAMCIKSERVIDGWWDAPLTASNCLGYKILSASDEGTDVSISLSGIASGLYYVGFICDGAGSLVVPQLWLE